MKQRLDAAAEQSGRSQSQEAEFRLDRSFEKEALLAEVLGLAFSRPTAGLLIAIGIVMEEVGYFHLNSTQMPRRWQRSFLDRHWANDRDAYDEAVRAANSLLKAVTPPLPKRSKPTRNKVLPHSLMVAREMVRAIRDQSEASAFKQSAPIIRSLLGGMAHRLSESRALSGSDPATAVSRSGSAARERPALVLTDAMCVVIAETILQLINSNPRTPSRDEIANAVLSVFRTVVDKSAGESKPPEPAPLAQDAPAATLQGSSETCCDWCDQPLSPQEAEAMRCRIGAAVRKGVHMLMPHADDKVCLLCERPIPARKLPEIVERLKQQSSEARERLQKEGVRFSEAERFDCTDEKAKRHKGSGQ